MPEESSPPVVWEPVGQRPSLAVLAAALAVFAICYGTVIASMVDIWSANALYSYGFLVPIISAYICWTMWQESPAVVDGPDYLLGMALTLGGVAILMVGRVASMISVEQASLVVTLAGFVLLIFGRRAFKEYWFPLAYLLLMVPMWNAPIERLQEPSRFVSARIASDVLDVIGIPVLREGTNIVLPRHTLAVMRECSGVNQLVAMIAMVVPAAYLWMTGRIRRIVLVVLAILITYLSNGFRIALVGWLAFRGLGDGNLLGSYAHVSEGLVVAMLGYVAVAACFRLLAPSGATAASVSTAAAPPASAIRRRAWLDAVVVVVMIAAGASRLLAVSRDVALNRDLRELPARIGDWTLTASGRSAPFRGVDEDLVDAYPTPEGESRFGAADDELMRAYRNPAGIEVQLYVAYYRHQEQGKELAGTAADQLGLAASRIGPGSNAPFDIAEVTREKDGVRRGILFWYDINGRIVSQIYQAKAYMIWDGLTRRRTDGAVVMLAWQGDSGVRNPTKRDDRRSSSRGN